MHTLPNLPPALVRQIFAELCAAMPLPANDLPDAIEARNDFAMASVVALRPADAYEARLAIQIVHAGAHADDCLRLAVEHRAELDKSLRCRAQAALMMRQEKSARVSLLEMQKQREMARPPEPAPAPDPQSANESGTGVPSRHPVPPGAGRQRPEPTPADKYAAQHPGHAAEIRAARGLTPAVKANIPPGMLPDPAILDGLINGDSFVLRTLDAINDMMAGAA